MTQAHHQHQQNQQPAQASSKASGTSGLVVGQRVSTNLYCRGMGTIAAIHGEQAPSSCGSMLGGVVRMGGRATFDIVFDNGAQSVGLPETILRGVQWRIYEDVIGADELAERVAAAEDYAEAKRREKAEADAAFALAVATLRVSPDFAFLVPGDCAAKNIRRHLKHAFPGVKFSVTTARGVSSVRIRWQDGPTIAAVDAVVDRYAAGSFDGMTDGYNYERSPWTEVFGSERYINTSREHSDALIEHAINEAFATQAVNLQGIERPTVVAYRSGALWSVAVCTSLVGVDDLQHLINRLTACTTVTAAGMVTDHGED